MGSTDNDDGVTAYYSRPTAVERVVAIEYRALPGELILRGSLASHYPSPTIDLTAACINTVHNQLQYFLSS